MQIHRKLQISVLLNTQFLHNSLVGKDNINNDITSNKL